MNLLAASAAWVLSRAFAILLSFRARAGRNTRGSDGERLGCGMRDEAIEDPLGWLLALRLKLRGHAEARALVDRALALVARAEGEADPVKLAMLQGEVDSLADDLALRFGAPNSAVVN